MVYLNKLQMVIIKLYCLRCKCLCSEFLLFLFLIRKCVFKILYCCRNETVTRAKWDAWNSCRGMSVDKAMQAYVEEVEKIDPSFKASEVKEDGVKASMFTHNEKIVKEGSLFEQKDIFVSWRPRYIILHKTFLHFCMDPSDHIPLNTMDLIGCTVTPVKPSKIGDKEIFPFVISHPHSTVTHNMASESQEAADDWIQTIRSVSSSSPSTSLMPSTITADDRILNRRPMEDDDERQQYQEEQAAKGRPLPAETVAPEITNRNIPPKYAPKVKKAIDLLVDWTSPGAENWTPLFEKDGIKAFTRVDKKVPCVFSEGVVGYPIHDVFRLLIANKRFTELDMQLYTNKRLKTFSINTTVEYLRWKQVWPLSARDMCNLFHWRLLKDGSIVAIQFSEKFDDVTSLKDGCVRCECILSGFVLKQVPEGTLVRHLSQIDLKGSLSASVADFFAFNQTVLIGNIRSVLDDDNKHGANKKVSFLGKLKQRNVTFEGETMLIQFSILFNILCNCCCVYRIGLYM